MKKLLLLTFCTSALVAGPRTLNVARPKPVNIPMPHQLHALIPNKYVRGALAIGGFMIASTDNSIRKTFTSWMDQIQARFAKANEVTHKYWNVEQNIQAWKRTLDQAMK